MPLNPFVQLHVFGAIQIPWIQGLSHMAKTGEHANNIKSVVIKMSMIGQATDFSDGRH